MNNHSWMWEMIQEVSVYAALNGLPGLHKEMRDAHPALVVELGHSSVLRIAPNLNDLEMLCAKGERLEIRTVI